MIVTDLYSNTEYITGVKDCQERTVLNGEKSLVFSVIEDDSNKHCFDLLREESIVTVDNNNYVIKQKSEYSIGMKRVKRCTGLHRFFVEMNTHYVYTTLSNTQTITACATLIFDNSNWSVTISGSFSNRVYENFGDDNGVSLLLKLCKDFGAEFEIDDVNRMIYIKNQVGNETDIVYRYNYNVKTLEHSVDTTNLYTHIKGFGKDSTYAEYTSPMVAIYGVRHQKPVKDERYTDTNSLLNRLMNEITDTPIISIKTDVVDLENEVNVGDSIFLIYEPLNIDVTARIVSLTRFPLENKPYVIEISNIRKNVVNFFTDVTKTTNSVKNVIVNNKVVTSALGDDVQQAVTTTNTANKQVDSDDVYGFVVRDAGNFQRFVCLKKGGIYYTDNNGFSLYPIITPDGIDLSRESIDASTLQGKSASAFSLSTHNHDTLYAAKVHNHDTVYAPIVHNHDSTYIKKVGTDDIEITDSLKGLIFKDKITNKRMRLTVENGLPVLTEVTTT